MHIKRLPGCMHVAVCQLRASRLGGTFCMTRPALAHTAVGNAAAPIRQVQTRGVKVCIGVRMLCELRQANGAPFPRPAGCPAGSMLLLCDMLWLAACVRACACCTSLYS